MCVHDIEFENRIIFLFFGSENYSTADESKKKKNFGVGELVIWGSV